MKISLDHLPRTARDLVDLIGLPATLRLVEARGGQLVTIPKRKRARGEALFQELVEIIGEPAAAALCQRYGGEYLTVPLCQSAMRAVHDAELQARFDALLAEGLGARAVANRLAGEYRMNWRTVFAISKRAAADLGTPGAVVEARQGELFA